MGFDEWKTHQNACLELLELLVYSNPNKQCQESENKQEDNTWKKRKKRMKRMVPQMFWWRHNNVIGQLQWRSRNNTNMANIRSIHLNNSVRLRKWSWFGLNTINLAHICDVSQWFWFSQSVRVRQISEETCGGASWWRDNQPSDQSCWAEHWRLTRVLYARV